MCSLNFSFAKYLGWASLALFACKSTPNCHLIEGIWSNEDGQTFIFQKNGTALWLIKFGSSTDTFTFKYLYNCQESPFEMDFLDFEKGPLQGKKMLGIIEWNNDSSFRLDAEPEIRPQTFNPKNTTRFTKTE